uniref:Uncharacterized protein n=1 Tax=Methanosarcina barkeri TaxID=2208 RepID=Q9HH19_METBA|nr:unknown [Methanosarcina barkeri]
MFSSYKEPLIISPFRIGVIYNLTFNSCPEQGPGKNFSLRLAANRKKHESTLICDRHRLSHNSYPESFIEFIDKPQHKSHHGVKTSWLKISGKSRCIHYNRSLRVQNSLLKSLADCTFVNFYSQWVKPKPVEGKRGHPVSTADFKKPAFRVNPFFLKNIEDFCDPTHTIFRKNASVRFGFDRATRAEIPVYKHERIVLINGISPGFRRNFNISFRKIGSKKRVYKDLKILFIAICRKSSCKNRPEIYRDFLVCRIKKQKPKCLLPFPNPQEPHLPCLCKLPDTIKIVKCTLNSPLGEITFLYKIDVFINAKEFL